MPSITMPPASHVAPEGDANGGHSLSDSPPQPRGTRGVMTEVAAGIVNWRHYGRDFWLCALVLFLVELGCAILVAPSPQLLEMAVCRKYYETAGSSGDDIPPVDRCKGSEVQVQLSIVLTTLSALSMLAGEDPDSISRGGPLGFFATR